MKPKALILSISDENTLSEDNEKGNLPLFQNVEFIHYPFSDHKDKEKNSRNPSHNEFLNYGLDTSDSNEEEYSSEDSDSTILIEKDSSDSDDFYHFQTIFDLPVVDYTYYR